MVQHEKCCTIFFGRKKEVSYGFLRFNSKSAFYDDSQKNKFLIAGIDNAVFRTFSADVADASIKHLFFAVADGDSCSGENGIDIIAGFMPM